MFHVWCPFFAGVHIPRQHSSFFQTNVTSLKGLFMQCHVVMFWHVISYQMMWCDVKVLSSFVYRYALMQSCWMENPLMRPTFGDITKCIKYLLRKVKVCADCILFTVAVIASNNPIVFFFLPFFSVPVHLYSYTSFTEKDIVRKFLSCCS